MNYLCISYCVDVGWIVHYIVLKIYPKFFCNTWKFFLYEGPTDVILNGRNFKNVYTPWKIKLLLPRTGRKLNIKQLMFLKNHVGIMCFFPTTLLHFQYFCSQICNISSRFNLTTELLRKYVKAMAKTLAKFNYGTKVNDSNNNGTNNNSNCKNEVENRKIHDPNSNVADSNNNNSNNRGNGRGRDKVWTWTQRTFHSRY